MLDSLFNNNLVHDFCNRFNGRSFEDIHTSLANQDKISSLIYRHRLLMYPHGQDINGVEWRWNYDEQRAEKQVADKFQTCPYH
jgi:hypothetical protein